MNGTPAEAGDATTPATEAQDALSVLVVRKAEDLLPWVPAWDRLAANAVEPNPFLESWMLIPALRDVRTSEDVCVLLVVARSNGQPAERLIGVVALERMPRFRGLPLTAYRLWRHRYSFLGTPLLATDRADDALLAILNWIRDAGRGVALEMELVSGDGGFQRCLLHALHRSPRAVSQMDGYLRAFFIRGTGGRDVDVSGKHRKDMRRLERRLGEQGQVCFEALDGQSNADPWIEEFLALEASGWKGREGSAFMSRDSDRTFLRSVAQEAGRRGRLMMLALRLDGRAIAMKCNFIGPDHGFAFKIAHDETYARFSPGVLLEIENVRQLETRPDIPWMDSCARPDHPMIDRLWSGRRAIQSVVLSTGTLTSEMLVAGLPLLRLLRRVITRKSKESGQ